jgi:hypothetical protein
MRTITISQKEGIRAVIGKPKGKKGTEVQSYLFLKTKGWTLEKAKTWFEEHKSESLPGHSLLFSLQFLTEKADPEAGIFPWSMPAKYYAKPGRLLIYGTALLAGETRKGDKFGCQELVRAARGLIGGPIEVFEHTWDVGESRWLPFPDNIILDGEEVDGRLEYIAGVSEPKVQELIRDATIAKVSVNAICRHVPAEDPGQCDGMILNGFCLLHKDSIPASPGTSVQIWNCLKVNPPDRLKSAGSPCLSESEGKNMSEKNEKQPPGAETKTEQVTGHGPVAGTFEPSLEDRVKTLEQRFENFDQRTSQEFTAINAKLDTLIQTKASAPTVIVAPTIAAVTDPNVKKEDLSKEEKVGEKPNAKTEKAPSTGQGITKPVGELPPAQPGTVPVTELKKVFDDQRLFTPQLRERAILRLIGEGDDHDQT